jgi:hypothetical protein
MFVASSRHGCRRRYIDEFDGVEGEDAIKAEISPAVRVVSRIHSLASRSLRVGPVACGIDALPLESWNGQGIIDGKTQGQVISHNVHEIVLTSSSS